MPAPRDDNATVAPEEAHAALLRGSLLRLTGRDLATGLDTGHGLAAAIRTAGFALVSHDASPDPLFTYGNDTALALFEVDLPELLGMPSRLSAEPVARADRDRLLARVAAQGFVDDYRGVRISATGHRFRIDDAVVWNLLDDRGALHGQAALIDRWSDLPDPATHRDTLGG